MDYQLIKNLAKQEKIEESRIIEILNSAIQEICRQKKTILGEVWVVYDMEAEKFLVNQVYRIVEKVNDPSQEITDENELLKNEKAQIRENRLFLPLDLKEIASYEEILQQFRLSLQKSQKNRWYEKLVKLLETEIPEIKKKEVIIKDILRCPGVVNKIIVFSKSLNISAKGACIGKEGSRARIIREEMGKERIEFVEWKENKYQLIAELLLPVSILYLCKLQSKKELIAVVPPEKMSLSLAPEGKIVQLIENYLGIKILIKTPKEVEKDNTITLWTANKNNWLKDKTKSDSEKFLYGSG